MVKFINMKKALQWYDWLPIIGIFPALYREAICPNRFIFFTWNIYQALLVTMLITKLVFL